MFEVRGEAPASAGEVPLAQTVQALGKEIRDLRASARLRAIIEQAKGILVERHGISLDEAFAQLRAMSQEHNVRLVEVAATIVGVTLPPEEIALGRSQAGLIDQQLPISSAVSGAWRALREQPDVRAGVASALTDALAFSTREGDQAAQLIFDLMLPYGARALGMYRACADGSLRLAGQVGLPGDVASSWRMVPPSSSIPLFRAAHDQTPIFWSTREEANTVFPGTYEANEAAHEFRATALIPVGDETGPVGAVSVMWDTDEVFDEVRKGAIASTVQRVAPLLIRNVVAVDPELDWLDAVMSSHLDPWLLLEAVVSENGITSDFLVRDAHNGAADGSGWVGRRALEVWPQMASEATLSGLVALMRTGGVWTNTVSVPTDLPWGLPGTQMRAVRLGSRAALVWRPPAP